MMSGKIIGFICFLIVGFLIISIGITDFFSKKAVGFWANAKVEAISDVKNYNRAVGTLFILYGLIFILLSVPLLYGQNSPFILLSILGIMAETIILMVIYTLVIEKKYKK